MNNSEIAALAESMNVSRADLMCLAQSVANSMAQDGVKSEMLTVELTEAYVPVAVKKFEQFAATYQTNPEAREAFAMSVLGGLQ